MVHELTATAERRSDSTSRGSRLLQRRRGPRLVPPPARRSRDPIPGCACRLVRRADAHSIGTRTRLQSRRTAPRLARCRPRRLRHGGPAQFGRLVRDVLRDLEARRRTAARLGQTAPSRATCDRRARRFEDRRGSRSRERTRRRGPGRRALPGHRIPSGRGDRRFAVARCRLPGVEGPDLRRLDRSTQAHRLGRAGVDRRRGARSVRLRGRWMSRDARAALSQRSCRLGVPGTARRQPCRPAPPVRSRGDARRHRAEPGRCGLPRAHHDEADLAPARGDPVGVRPVVRAGDLAPRRAVPSVAQGGVDRVARPRADLRALRRDRGSDGHDHHRHGVAGAPRFGGPAEQRRGDDRRPRRQPAARR